MKESYKKRIHEAWQNALAQSPRKNNVIEGIFINKRSATVQDVAKMMLKDPEFYTALATRVTDERTLDTYIRSIPQNIQSLEERAA